MGFFEQVVHVFRKDVRRYWLALAALGAAIVAQVVFGIDVSGRYGMRLGISMGLLMLGLVALTALVVQEDSPAGDRAFWSTRPISGGALLAAKLLFVGLLLVTVPAIAQTVWFESLGVDFPRWIVTGETALYVGGTLAMVALGAAVTRTLRGFLVLAIGVGMATSALTGQLMRMDPNAFEPGYRLTGGWLQQWAWLAIGGGLLVHQYVTRRTVRTVAIGAALVPLALWGAYRSGLNLASWAAGPERYAFHSNAGIRIHDPALSRSGEHWPASSSADGETLRLQASVSSDDGVDLRMWRSTSRIHGGGVDNTFSYEPPAGRVSGSPFSNATGLEGMTAVGGPISFPRLVTGPVASGGRAELDALGSADRLEVDVSFDVFRQAVVGSLALEVGASLRADDRVYTVRDVQRTPGSVLVEVATRSLNRPLGSDVDWPMVRRPYVVLHNPVRAEYMVTGESGRGSEHHAFVPGASVVDDNIRYAFSAPSSSRDGTTLPDGWFDGVQLLITRLEYAGSTEISAGWTVDEWPGYGAPVPIGLEERR